MNDRSHFTATPIINVKIIKLAHLLFLSGIVAGLTMASPSLATTTPNGTKSSATEAVKGTINDLIQVLDDETLKQPEQAEERRHEIEKIIKHRVDYEEMARRALGAPRSTLSQRDQYEFVDLFVQLLRDTFGDRITEHSDEQVVFLGEFWEDVFAVVKAYMKGRKIDTPVDFRLIHRAQEWQVYDMVIDGASNVSNYRSQFHQYYS